MGALGPLGEMHGRRRLYGRTVPQLMPGVCVKTGRPAVTTQSLKVQHIPRWVYFLLPLALLLVGILLIALIAEATATKFTIVFPVSAEVAADRRRRIRLAWGFGALGVSRSVRSASQRANRCAGWSQR